MTPEQKQRAAELLAAWLATAYALHGDAMADLLQELINAPADVLTTTNQAQTSSSQVEAPAPEPVAVVSNFFTGRTLIIANKGIELPDGAPLYAAPPAPSVPDELSGRFTDPAKLAADLPAWENGDDPLVCGGLISRGVVDFATVGIWPTKPAPSVPVEPMENIALNEWLDKTEWVQKEINTFPVSSLGMHRADVMRLEIERLRKLLAAAPPPPPKLSDERILEIYASESGRPVTMGKARIIAQARAIEREILGGGDE